MLSLVLKKQTSVKYLVSFAIYAIFFMVIYFLLDSLNGGYYEMSVEYGSYLVYLNIGLNIVMSLVSAFMFNLSSALVDLTKKEGKGTFMTMFSVLFGVLTYGCTSCVIAFFAVIGITFSVAVLPLAGLPYKLISLGLLVIGFFWLLREIKRSQCKL
ncbi:hypothetical protein [Paracholeplasma manati]|uniref:Integral membrane protein n=1 Tax=Paracholeplasma manati TaxID=591373 RepID=A0ABT2Y724_9MOLU|nr:hypothetical protein [Paracholeplasma manati]MCV2232525.1 hypothetical protein [Paracholeplasma manati]MDG0889018.1 hypothetical protein [Paracholeplasma manati]